MATKAYVDIHGRNKTDRAFSKVQSNVSNLDKSFKRLNGGIAAFGIGVALTKMTSLGKGAIDAADAVEKLSRRTGQSAAMISQMRFALSQNDATLSDYGNSLRNINKNTQNAVDGLQTQSRAFGKLGISVAAFAKLDTDQKFIQLSEAISRVEDPSIRTQVAMDIMGRAGERLLPVMENGAEGIAKYREKAIELGQSLSEGQVKGAAAAADALDELSKSISGSFSQAILQYSDEVSRLAKFFQETIPSAIGATVTAFNAIGPAILPALSAFAAVKVSIAVWAALKSAVVASGLSLSMFTARASVASASASAMSVSVGVLRGAMALLGGPAGIIALAVGALAIFISRSQQAKNANIEFIKSINLASESTDLNDSLTKTIEIINGLEAELSSAEAQLISSNKATGLFASGSITASVSIERLKSEIEQAKKASENITNQIKAQSNITNNLSKSTEIATASFSSLTGVVDKNSGAFKKNKDRVSALIKDLEKTTSSLNKVGKRFGEYNTAVELITGTIKKNNAEQAKLGVVLQDLDRMLKNGSITLNEYEAASESLGFSTEKTTTVMATSWERFKDSAFSSLETFYRSGLDGTKSFSDSIKSLFKDMVASVLAQITALVAANAFKKFVNFVGGNPQTNGFFDGVGGLFTGSGGSDASSGLSAAAGSIFGDKAGQSFNNVVSGGSSALGVVGGVNQIDQGLEQGGTQGAFAVASGIATTVKSAKELLELFDKIKKGQDAITFATLPPPTFATSAAPVVTGTSEVAATTGGAAAGGIPAGVTAASAWIAVGLLFDKYLGDGHVTEAFGVEAQGRYEGAKDLFDGNISAFRKAQFTAPIDAIKSAFGGRSTDELGMDQFRDVLKAVEEERSEVVQVGQAANFIGGYNDETVFFQALTAGVDLEKVSELLKERLGADDVREIADGVLRIEDKESSFAENHAEVTRQVLLAIAEVEIGFTDLEVKSVKSMGAAFNKMDDVFDSSLESGLSVQERMLATIGHVYDKSIAESQLWLDNVGISADRFNEIFSAASGSTLTGVVNDFAMATDAIGGELDTLGIGAVNTFGLIQGGLADIQGSTDSVVRRFNESRNNLTVVQGGNQRDNQSIDTNRNRDQSNADIVEQLRIQNSELALRNAAALDRTG